VIHHGSQTIDDLNEAGLGRLARDAAQVAGRGPAAFQSGLGRVAELAQRIMSSCAAAPAVTVGGTSASRQAVLQDRAAHELAEEVRHLWSMIRAM